MEKSLQRRRIGSEGDIVELSSSLSHSHVVDQTTQEGKAVTASEYMDKTEFALGMSDTRQAEGQQQQQHQPNREEPTDKAERQNKHKLPLLRAAFFLPITRTRLNSSTQFTRSLSLHTDNPATWQLRRSCIHVLQSKRL